MASRTVRVTIDLARLPRRPWWTHALCILTGHQWTGWFRQGDGRTWGRICRRCDAAGWHRR